LSVTGVVVVGNFPYGNPGSVGEPLGIFHGQATLVGDASGGFVQLSWIPQNPFDTPTLADQRRQYVYFVDGQRMTANADSGSFALQVFAHWARSNIALAVHEYRAAAAEIAVAVGLFEPSQDLVSEAVSRMPIFWDTQEFGLAGSQFIAQQEIQNNVDLTNYVFSIYGRYYDRQIISNRAFGRLIAQSPTTQFEG